MQLTLDQAGDNVLRGRGNGTLNLHVNPVDKEFTIYGDYDITEGSYRFSLQNFATRNFLIQEGSNIQWTGDPADALVNITAVYKLKASLGSAAQRERRRAEPAAQRARGVYYPAVGPAHAAYADVRRQACRTPIPKPSRSCGTR